MDVLVRVSSAFLKQICLSPAAGLCSDTGTRPALHVLVFFWVKNSWESCQEQVCCASVANGCSAQGTCPEPVAGEQTFPLPSLQTHKKPQMHMVCVSGLQHQLCSLCYDPVYAAEPRCA